MNLWARVRSWLGIKNEAESIPLSDPRVLDLFGIGPTFAGPVVNAETAMRASAVFACVRLISGAVSCSPVRVYRRSNAMTRVEAPTHPLAAVLLLRPNRIMTAATFWKTLTTHKLLSGNAYAHIVRTKNGLPVALIPLKPRNVAVYWAWELGLDVRLGVERNRLFYRVTFDDGRQSVFDQMDIIHVPNIGGDGKTALSTVSAMAQAVGLSLATEEHGARFFGNGATLGGIISTDQQLTKEQREDLRASWEARHSGAQNAHKTAILSNGMKFSPMAITNNDAQFLETRQFSVIDICRFFGVNPVMVGESEKTSSWGSGVEQMGRWFNTLTMNEHFISIEQELEVKLFGGDGHFAEFDESELTRGDMKARAEYYKAALGSPQQPGWLTPNEVRADEGRAPMDGSDELQKPVPGQQAATTEAQNAPQ